MPNEFIARNGLIAQNNTTITGSLTVTNGITGSFSGTASFATSASFAISASWAPSAGGAATPAFPFSGSAIITGSLSQGANNTAFGVNSLKSNTTGTNNTSIGYQADVASGSLNYSTSIGNAASCTASNQITLGNSSITSLRCQVQTITGISDQRDKKDIETLESSLAFVEQLKPVRFIWNMRDGGKVDIPEIGFIAQDLQQVQLDTGIKIPNLVYESNPEKLEASYGTLLPLLVKSIQELSHKNQELSQEITDLKQEITDLKNK